MSEKYSVYPSGGGAVKGPGLAMKPPQMKKAEKQVVTTTSEALFGIGAAKKINNIAKKKAGRPLAEATQSMKDFILIRKAKTIKELDELGKMLAKSNPEYAEQIKSAVKSTKGEMETAAESITKEVPKLGAKRALMYIAGFVLITGTVVGTYKYFKHKQERIEKEMAISEQIKKPVSATQRAVAAAVKELEIKSQNEVIKEESKQLQAKEPSEKTPKENFFDR